MHAVCSDPHASELVVVVDGDDDASMELLGKLAARLPRLVVTQIDHRGQLGALEAGVERSQGEVVLLLDDDVLPLCHLATGHARHHAQREGLVVVGPMPVRLPQTHRASPATLLYAKEYAAHWERIVQGQVAVLEHLWMGNVSLRRTDALSIGLTSTDFPALYHCDRELGLRLAKAGLVGVHDESLAAVHLHDRRASAFLREAELRGAGLARLQQLHPEHCGPTERAVVTEGLGPLGAAAIYHLGRSGLGPVLARGALGFGGLVGRLGMTRGELVAARLARRLMICHGTTANAALG